MGSKTYIITGANRGLGEALVSKLTENRNNEVISISRKITQEQNNLANSKNHKFEFVKTDLFVDLDIDFFNYLQTIIQTNNIVFINNAASITPIKKTGKFSSIEINNLFNLNVKNPIRLINYLLGSEFERLQVINISSGAANKAIDGWSLYCSTKASLEMFIKVADLENPNVSFLNLDPGVMDTDMQKNIRESSFKDRENFLDLKNKNKLRTPIDVALDILTNIK